MVEDIVQRKTLSEVVASKIKSYIIDNSLRSGDRLPTEQEMADRFGVSRISVREATKALSFLGIIRSAPRRGLTVGEVDIQRVSEYLGFHFALNNYPKERLRQARIVIETGALPYAMKAMAKDCTIYDKLIEIVSRMNPEDQKIYVREDVDFHRTLVEASGIEPLVAFNDLLQVFFKRFESNISAPVNRQSGVASHTRIVNALRDGQLEIAEQELRKHLSYNIPD